MSVTRRRVSDVGAIVVVAMVALGGCGDRSSTGTTPAPTEISSTVAATTTAPTSAPPSVPTTDAPTTAPGPVSTCAEGELPAAGAVDLVTGEVQWAVCSTAELFRDVVGSSDEVVVLSELTLPGEEVVVRSLADGTERWRRPVAGQPTAMPVGSATAGGIVLSGIGDDTGGIGLAGLDADTGDVVWQLDERLMVLGQSETVAVVAGVDPGAGGPPVVRGIDRATGAEVWTSDVVFADYSGVGVARSPAVVWDSTIAIPTGQSLTALDIATGAVRWVGPQTDHPVAAESVVVGTIDNGRRIRALDAFSGELLWEAPGRASYGELLAIGDGIVVVNALDTPELVAHLLRDGSERWRVDKAGFGEPQLTVGTTVVTLWEGSLAALSTADGSVLWAAEEPFGSPWMTTVAVVGSTMVVAINSRPWAD